MRAVAIYTRQSLDRQGDGLGVSRQELECRKLCEYRGWQVAHVLADNDASATTGIRPNYQRLLRLIESRSIEAVVVLRVDRLLRKMTDLEELIELCERTGVSVITVEGDIQLNTVMGRQVARIMASVARGEAELKGARHKLANEQRAKAGLPHAGRRAYGYHADGLTVREDEALILKDIGHKFLNGWSFTAIADWLNEQGYTTTTGRPFYAIAIRQMLLRKRYKGVREHDGLDYPAQWPAIFDEDTYDRIQYKVKERSQAAGNKPMARRYLLTGLVHCGRCGAPMNGTMTYDRKTRAPRKSYRCNRVRRNRDGGPGCGKVTRGSVPLECFIRELICHRLDSPELARLLEDGQHQSLTPLLERRAALDTKLSELLDDYTDGTITKAEYKRAKERTLSAMNKVEQTLQSMQHETSLSGLLGAGAHVRERWAVESEGWQRQLIAMLVERIDVNRGSKLPRVVIERKTYYFASEYIDVQWRA